MEFWFFLATVALAFGLLSWGHLIFNNIIHLCCIIFMLFVTVSTLFEEPHTLSSGSTDERSFFFFN